MIRVVDAYLAQEQIAMLGRAHEQEADAVIFDQAQDKFLAAALDLLAGCLID